MSPIPFCQPHRNQTIYVPNDMSGSKTTHKLRLQFPPGSFLLARQWVISLGLNQTCLLIILRRAFESVWVPNGCFQFKLFIFATSLQINHKHHPTNIWVPSTKYEIKTDCERFTSAPLLLASSFSEGFFPMGSSHKYNTKHQIPNTSQLNQEIIGSPQLHYC